MNSPSTNQNQNQNKNQGQNQNQKNKNPNSQTNQVQAVQGQMDQSDRRFWTITAISVVVIAIIAWGVYHNEANAPSQSPSDMTGGLISTSTMDDTDIASASTTDDSSGDQTYTYSCDGEKNMSATFHLPKDDFANVNLSDGRHFILAHAISADGARYANANESIVFWTRGETAFMQENGTTTYSGCIANRFP